MIIVSKEEGAKWPNLGSLTELRGFYGSLDHVKKSGLAMLQISIGLEHCLSPFF